MVLLLNLRRGCCTCVRFGRSSCVNIQAEDKTQKDTESVCVRGRERNLIRSITHQNIPLPSYSCPRTMMMIIKTIITKTQRRPYLYDRYLHIVYPGARLTYECLYTFKAITYLWTYTWPRGTWWLFIAVIVRDLETY